MKFLFAILFSVLFVVGNSIAAKSSPVTTSLNAKWNATPVHLEIAEFLHDENPNLYFDYVEALNHLPVPLYKLDTDLKVYEASISAAEKLIDSNQLPLLKLALSMRTMSPRIQAHFQMAHEALKIGNCTGDVFITVGDLVACSIDEFADIMQQVGAHRAEKIAKREKQRKEEGKTDEDEDTNEEDGIHSFDHVYPESIYNVLPVILYGEIGTKNFKKFYDHLVMEVRENIIRFVSRHFIRNVESKPARLSGYGVELIFKSDVYNNRDETSQTVDVDNKTMPTNAVIDDEIMSFDFEGLAERHPTLARSINRLKSSLINGTKAVPSLTKKQFRNIGVRACVRAARIEGDEALQILQFTTQNFPTQVISLLEVKGLEEFKLEMRHNIVVLFKKMGLGPGGGELIVGGIPYKPETLDVGALTDILRTDLHDLQELFNLNITYSLASELQKLDLTQSKSTEFAVNIDDPTIKWLNDIETDEKYRHLSPSIVDLLKTDVAELAPRVRKNLFNLVVIFDPIIPASLEFMKQLQSFVNGDLPVRFGIVFDSRQTKGKSDIKVYRNFFCVWNYISHRKEPKAALSFMIDLLSHAGETLNSKMIRTYFKKSYELTDKQMTKIFAVDSDFDFGRATANKFVNQIVFKEGPQALFNGVLLDESVLIGPAFDRKIQSEMNTRIKPIHEQVAKGILNDEVDIVRFIMYKSNVMPRLNPRLMSTKKPVYMDLKEEASERLLLNLSYFTSEKSTESVLGVEISFLTLWISTDLTQPQGVQLLKNALIFMKKTASVRVAFFPSVEVDSSEERSNLNLLVWQAMNTLPGPEATATVLKWLTQTKETRKIPEACRTIMSSKEFDMRLICLYMRRILKIEDLFNAVFANGKLIGPFDEGEMLTVHDFTLIDRLHNFYHGEKIRSVLKNYDHQKESNGANVDGNFILKVIGLLAPRSNGPRKYLSLDIKDEHSVIKLPPKQKNAPFIDVFAVLDPASHKAQKLTPVLVLLRKIVNCNMRIVLITSEQLTDMPVKSFYRLVVEPELKFEPNGELSSGAYAKFTGLAAKQLLTQKIHPPQNWLVQMVRSNYDLDNIKLNHTNGPVNSEYELEYLLVEGSCFNVESNLSARGVEITLESKPESVIFDTMVINNFGYFQLKASPGAWNLSLRTDSHKVVSVTGLNLKNISEDTTRVIINSFRSNPIDVSVIKNKLYKPTKADSTKSDTINIFTVASGHVYERLLRIMMVSLMKQTKQPVKFWFLKSYLSPEFHAFLPHMAKEYNFQYELVQYKWPHWLNKQTEKQRTIWAYKILFLDVLFPLDVERIIFVDADAVVRADINELHIMNLEGAVYAYTPFCETRDGMEEFRFWHHGYWKNRLQHRKYHISALYIVDLKRLRKTGAGDLLRSHYHLLSQKEGNLKNLDQDLPNDLIHNIPLKTLPQEWLWCQTWCGDGELSSAKVVDLCNNPRTRDSKITVAQRIIPEWKEYDNEITDLKNRIEENVSIQEQSAPIQHTEL